MPKTKRKTKKQKEESKSRKFRGELKKALNTAVGAAFGFLIALAWRDAITEYVDVIASQSPVQGKIITAITITIISVIGIMIATKYLSEEM